jgi:collagen type III alpha
MPAEHPFGTPQSSEHPFGTPQSSEHPFGTPQSSEHPFGRPASGGPPFSEPASGGPSGFDHAAPHAGPGPSGAGPSGGRDSGDFGSIGFGPDNAGAPARDNAGAPGPEHPGFGGPGPAGTGGYAQRVPGASFAASGMPAVVEPRNSAVPQPRDAAEHPAVGSARAVSASASVPVASRVAPTRGDEIPPPSAAPQARVYGRATQPTDTGDDGERGAAPATPYHSYPEPDQHGPGGGATAAPQPPARASGRASASARVAPPGSQPASPPAPEQGPPYAEPTDVAGRGRANAPGKPASPGPYSELTTDISHRGQATEQPYVPVPALPSMHARPPLENGFPPPPDADEKIERPDRPRMGGVFPGPASRATVTPPGPNETTSWPAGPADAEQGRFDQFKPDAAAKPETPHVRMLPVLLGVIIGAALLVGLAIGIVWLISRGSDTGGFSVSAGDCVKRSGTEAVKAACGDPDAFQVVSIADTKEQCADPAQPYVLNPTSDGKTQVLCLKPSS